MGKWAAAAAISGVGGTGGAATLAAHSMGAFGGGGKGTSRGIGNSSGVGTTVSEFEKNPGRCFSTSSNISGVFDKWEDNGQIGGNGSLAEISQSSEVQWESGGSSQAKGCLDYEWTTKDNEGKQWDSIGFRLIWVLAKGNRAFSVYLTAKGKSDKSFDFDGTAYTFSRETDKGWKVDRKLKMKDGVKNVAYGEIKNRFPKSGTTSAFTTGAPQITKESYWNLLKGDGTELLGTYGSKNEAFFVFTSGSSGDLVGSWSPNLKDWWEYFFDKSKWDMEGLVKEIKGTWAISF